MKWILASDIHFPKHDKRLVDIFFEVINKWKPDAIDLVGDIDDAEGTSRWASGSIDEATNPIVEDMKVLRQFSADLRKAAPKADIHWHDGNHGWTRHEGYIKTKAQALNGLIDANFLYDLDKNGINWHSYSDPPVQRFGNMHVHHGVAISKHSGQSVKADVEDWNVSLVRGHCFSEDTEILTPSGWKSYDQIKSGDYVMTLNRETNKGEWNEVSEKFVYDDFSELISLKSHGLDLLVTEDHGLLAKSPGGKEYKEHAAIDIYGKRVNLPLALIHDEPGLPISDNQIKFLAWLMTDGCIENGPVRISHEWISKYLDSNKAPTDNMRGMSYGQIKIFLESFIDGNGTKNKDAINSWQINTARKDHLDLCQEFAARAGFRSSVSRSPNRSHWTLTLNSKSSVSATKWDKVKYDGKVWCVSVKNGTLLVRRNGKTAITLNSHRQGMYRKTVVFTDDNQTITQDLEGYEIGHLCKVSEMKYSAVHNWQPGFAIANVVDGRPHIQLIPIHDYTCVVDGVVVKG